MKLNKELSDEARKMITFCAEFGVELCEWQQDWINRWIAAGRPQLLTQQYRLMTPIEGERSTGASSDPRRWFN